jgi:ribosomal protein S18 acetylase RimI-like enzyme
MRIRPATADDAEFLTDMLLEAFNWSGEQTFDREQVLADDHIHRYIDGWPRPGDFGVVATGEDDVPVGAAWARTLTAERAGYGYVANDVPELSIGVAPVSRGQGVGRALLSALIDTARDRGLARISLSVEPENRAAELYRSLGFVVVGQDGGSDTMVLRLDAG